MCEQGKARRDAYASSILCPKSKIKSLHFSSFLNKKMIGGNRDAENVVRISLSLITYWELV